MRGNEARKRGEGRLHAQVTTLTALLCGVVWCGVVWCGVVWCGVVSCDLGCDVVMTVWCSGIVFVVVMTDVVDYGGFYCSNRWLSDSG